MKRLISLIVIISCSNHCFAKDFGQHGQVFEIKEEGFIAMVKRKLAKLDIREEQSKMIKLAKERVTSPSPVKGVVTAEEERTFYFDPTYILKEDIILPCGKVLFKAGTSVNPLDHMVFDRKLWFIDGRDQEQVEWLKEEIINTKKKEENMLQDRVILTGGKIFDLQKQIGKELYFDQGGELTGKFGIKAVPAIVTQEERFLKIKEIVMLKE